MLKLKKSCTWLLAVGMLTVMSCPVMAAENFGPEGNGVVQPDGSVKFPPTTEQQEQGHTTFSIIEARQNPNNVSFTVPLYVTMAVVEGEENVVVPNNYSIVNTSKSSGVSAENKPPFDIAVVNMEFTKLDGSTYKTVSGPTVTQDKDILLQIGKVTMPALGVSGSADVTLRAENSQFLEDSSAPNFATSKWKKIPAEPGSPEAPANELKLDLNGKVKANASLTNQAAAAQFRVKYTVSALDDNGKPLGSVYAGDDRVEAGLGGVTP